MWFQKISTPCPWKGIGNSEGGRGGVLKFVKESMKLTLNVQMGGSIHCHPDKWQNAVYEDSTACELIPKGYQF